MGMSRVKKLKIEGEKILLQKLYLHKIKKFGQVEVLDNEIVCRVDGRKLKRNCKDIIYQIKISNTPPCQETIRKALEKVNLNQEVHYVFDGILFDSAVEITSFSKCHLEFRNCTFHGNIGIRYAHSITLENNTYLDEHNIYYYKDSYLSVNCCVDKLVIHHDNFINSANCNHFKNRFGMDIRVSNLEIIDSNIQADFLGSMTIQAQNCILKKATITSNQVYMDAKKMDMDKDSTINAYQGIMIDSESKLNIENIQSPYIVYNGNVIDQIEAKKQSIFDNSDELGKARLQLLDRLYKMKDICTNYQLEVVGKVERELNQKPISKIIKKGTK